MRTVMITKADALCPRASRACSRADQVPALLDQPHGSWLCIASFPAGFKTISSVVSSKLLEACCLASGAFLFGISSVWKRITCYWYSIRTWQLDILPNHSLTSLVRFHAPFQACAFSSNAAPENCLSAERLAVGNSGLGHDIAGARCAHASTG